MNHAQYREWNPDPKDISFRGVGPLYAWYRTMCGAPAPRHWTLVPRDPEVQCPHCLVALDALHESEPIRGAA